MEYEEDNDDQMLGVSTVLPVAEGDDFEMNLPPVDGMDFLRRVRMEAKSCPATVTVDLQLPIQEKVVCVKDRILQRSSAISGHHLTSCSPAPQGYAPSLEWQNRQVANFSSVRMKFAKYVRENKHSRKKALKNLPNIEDASAWCHFCFGRSIDNQGPSHTEEQGETTSSAPAAIKDEGRPPVLSIITSLDQDSIIQVLEHHITWFEATGFTRLQGQWFYALLAALEKPLLPEACSLLRTLARICSNLRASLAELTDDLLPQLNLLICIVSRYFDQTDLSDNPS